MTPDLLLEPSCGGCGETSDLYGSQCKHMTLCESCGKTMAENKAKCHVCGHVLTRLIKEYKIRASTASDSDKSYFIGRFRTGLPEFPKKTSAENKWTLRKDLSDIPGPTKATPEKLKTGPWVLEDETGQPQYTGILEGSSLSSYYLLVPQGKASKEFSAIPASSVLNFNKVAQHKQLTLEEAEEKMTNRKKTRDGYARWMMKSGTKSPGPLGEKEPGKGGAKGHNKMTADDNSEMGEDWEHEEIFTDDDEAVAVDPVDREEFGPEVPAPPEIKQKGDDLSQHGKELKKLLENIGDLDDSSGEEHDDYDMDDDIIVPQPLAPRQKDAPEQEPVDNIPVQLGESGGYTAPVTEEEIRAVLMLMAPMTTRDFLHNFRARLKTEEEKNTFVAVLKKISETRERGGKKFVVLKKKEAAQPNEELDNQLP